MGLFKTFTYNVFDYKPRYYDPKTDELHEKVMARRRDEGKDGEAVETEEYKPGSSIRGSFRSKMRRTSYGGTKKSTIRVFCIAVFLFFLAYLILFVDLSGVISYISKL